MKAKARRSLIRLHSLGVIHGDVALRNILFRETDGAVLWIDFEFASIMTNENELSLQATEELRAFEQELANINTLEEKIVSDKRAKVC